MAVSWKSVALVCVIGGGAAAAYYWTSTTEVCSPYRTSDGSLDARCERIGHEQARYKLRTEPTAFIPTQEAWQRVPPGRQTQIAVASGTP